MWEQLHSLKELMLKGAWGSASGWHLTIRLVCCSLDKLSIYNCVFFKGILLFSFLFFQKEQNPTAFFFTSSGHSN